MSKLNKTKSILPTSSATLPAAMALCLALAACGHDDTPSSIVQASYDTPEKLMIAPCDLNGDHVITKEEVEQIIAAQMEEADTNRDGTIDTSEASARNMKQASSMASSEQTPLTDWTGDGIIDSDEFGAALHTAFERLDSNQDGKVKTDELNQVLRSILPSELNKKDPADKQIEDGSTEQDRR